jgi:hypothetical protein
MNLPIPAALKNVRTLTVLGLAALIGLGSWAWQQRRQPTEVQTLQEVVQRLGRGNNLGKQPISFMVASGGYAAYLAQQRGLCKPNQCELFTQLNPYKHYGNGWDELIRQGYALDGIEGWATASRTVVIPQSTFRTYGTHNGYLACTVAHEIAHVLRHHVFLSSYQENHNLKKLTEKPKELALMRVSREHELEADRDSADMLVRAGFKGRICQQGLAFMHRSNGDGSATEPESTHPGYEERVRAIRLHYDALEKKPPKPQPSTQGSFRYDAANNLLTFSPKP